MAMLNNQRVSDVKWVYGPTNITGRLGTHLVAPQHLAASYVARGDLFQLTSLLRGSRAGSTWVEAQG